MRSLAGAPILTAAQMRAVEQSAFACGETSADALMERAGIAVAREVRRLANGRAIVVVAGPGNNGGDAYVAARVLAQWGHSVLLAASAEPATALARSMAARWTGRTVPLGDVEQPEQGGEYVVIDGLFGTGGSRDTAPIGWQPALFAAAAITIAIDVPSWIDADTGDERPWHPRRHPTLTLALGALKPAHVLAPERCGHIVHVDFGDEQRGGFTQALRRHQQEHGASSVLGAPSGLRPQPHDHKYRSKATIVAGSMGGAARLAARGAAGAGAGYVVMLGDTNGAGPFDAIVHQPIAALADALGEERGAVLVGPGLGRDDEARRILDAALASRRPLVLDGDALSLLGKSAAARLSPRHHGAARTILTPHEAEFARMFGTGGGNKIERTVAASRATGATIVHKGHATVIAQPSGRTHVSNAGSSWLATAGTGDVLAGAIAARLACASEDASPPAQTGVWLHARASLTAGPAFTADRLAELLPAAIWATW